MVPHHESTLQRVSLDTASPDLQFINITASYNTSVSHSKAIRSHVARRWRRERNERRNTRKPLPPFNALPKPFAESLKDYRRERNQQLGYGAPVRPFLSTSPSNADHEQSGTFHLSKFTTPVISPDSKINFLDSGLNPYNFLPINATPRVVSLLRHS